MKKRFSTLLFLCLTLPACSPPGKSNESGSTGAHQETSEKSDACGIVLNRGDEPRILAKSAYRLRICGWTEQKIVSLLN